MLDRALSDKRTTIVERWLQVVLSTYSEEATRSMRRQSDRFANPAGHLIIAGIGTLFDELAAGARPDRVAGILEDMLKLRAVQDFSPSQAVGFVGAIKKVVHTEPGMNLTAEQWAELDERVDRLQLSAFDVYMRCRERVYEVRYNQLKKMNHTLLTRASRVLDVSVACGALAPMQGASDEDNRGEDR